MEEKQLLAEIRQEERESQAEVKALEEKLNKNIRTTLNINCNINPAASTFANAISILGNTYASQYFSRVDNLAFHDLTEGKIIPPSTADLLGYGSKFIVKPPKTTSHIDLMENMTRFKRDMYLKSYFAGPPDPRQERKRSKLYLKSKWTPKSAPSQVDSRLFKFTEEISEQFKAVSATSNLLPHELKLLSELISNENIVIAQADKGLGPCAVTLEQYIRDGLKHLGDKRNYDILNEEAARSLLYNISEEITRWLNEFEPQREGEKIRRAGAGGVNENDANYIRVKLAESWASDPFAYFYLTYKVHKDPLKTRPVVSTCGCISYALGQWVDMMLQPMAQAQRSYFKDSFALKKLLNTYTPPANSSIFSFDAVSMYSNINSDACLIVMTEYLRKETTKKKFKYHPDALIEAIGIILRSNVMKFGDIFVKQTSGVAMGICPAPPLATLFFAFHEDVVFDKWKHCISFNRRFIDDGLAVWLHQSTIEEDEKCWQAFQDDINDYHGLKWTFTKREKSVDFMDMKISIQNNEIVTDLFEKKMALYLYIPPHSAHPPGVLTGLIMGQVFRIFNLCSNVKDMQRHILNFHDRLCRRGYSHKDLLPLFEKAAKNAEAFKNKSEEEKEREKIQKEEAAKKRIFLHLKYHPNDPKSSTIQRLFKNCIMHPPGQKPFNEIENDDGHQIPLERLTVCYSTHPNLGALFSYRKICKRKGLKVSSFLNGMKED